MTDRAWFSHLVRHPARKRSGSILTTLEPARGSVNSEIEWQNHTINVNLDSGHEVLPGKVVKLFVHSTIQQRKQQNTDDHLHWVNSQK